MKKINKTSVVSLLILVISFIVIRYVLFETHGMKQFSFMLFLPLLLVMIILCFMKVKIIPFVAAISYPIGFIIADLFQINGVDAGGGATSNLWIIWTSVIATMIVASIVVELINSKKVKG
ncbi:MAG: hypothetical protein QM204_00985 [Bacillota bacterium]|nr:hypothetical protein [Bacillota bacterium]NLL26283.1 hypothetical protein [Erysipelotrichia bacterium]